MLIVSPQFLLAHDYSFYPSKEEILQFYLPPAINGEPLPSNALIEREIYGENKEPWNVFDKDNKMLFWVFAKLKKSKARIDRTAGSGTWLGRSIKEVKDERDHQDDSTAEVGSDHHHQDYSTAEVESTDKKRKALEVNDEQIKSVLTVKKICVDDQISYLNQGNAE
ncbi:hypothetical protein CRYUN_Cryun11dG0081700 [Craigia yunnanensis]